MSDNTTLQMCQAFLLAQGRFKPGPPWWWSAIIAPAATATFGVMVAWLAIKFDHRKNINQELIKKRIEIYANTVPKLNALLCFHLIIGRWKELTPDQIIAYKRELDHDFHIYESLFSQNLYSKYNAFIKAYFSTFTGYGEAAKIRLSLERARRHWKINWNPTWDHFFSDETENTDKNTVRRLYFALMDQFAIEIGARPKKGHGPRKGIQL